MFKLMHLRIFDEGMKDMKSKKYTHLRRIHIRNIGSNLECCQSNMYYYVEKKVENILALLF